MTPLPNFLIIGAQKAGTTSLARWLGAHPDVFLPPGKELFFFNVPERWARGLDWYRRQFAGATGMRAAFEATPGYLGNPEAHERIARTLPGVRLIALLRHPADRAYSQYWHNRSMGTEKRSFARVVEDELSGAPPFDFYLERGRYFKHLTALRELFPVEDLLPLLFDDLVIDPAGVFVRACRFVGVDDALRPANLGKAENVRLVFRSRRLYHAVRYLRARRLLSSNLAGRLRAWNVRSRAKPYPPMDPKIRMTLIESYEEQTAGLEQLLGRDLSSWRR